MKKIPLFCLCLLITTVLVNAQTKVVPIIEIKSGALLGGSENGKWLDAKSTFQSLTGEESYNVFKLSSISPIERKFEKPKDEGIPCEDFYSIGSEEREGFGVALSKSAKWNSVPRTVVSIDTNNAVYKKAVTDVLRSKGIIKSKVTLTKVYRVDLEGDGKDEVVIESTNFPENITPDAPAGSYSMVLLRKIVNGKVQNLVVSGSFFPRAKKFVAPDKYELSGIADLNGDGKMEIVIFASYYEGIWVETYEIVGNKPELVKTLQVGCGV